MIIITDSFLADALDAFWEVVAKKFPMVTTGDFPPDAEVKLSEAAHQAVYTWLRYNLPQPLAGTRVTLTRDVERFPDFMARAGSTGTIVESGDDQVMSVKLDNPPKGSEEWDGCVHWTDGYDDPWWDDLRV